MSKCLGYMNDDSVEVMSDFGKMVDMAITPQEREADAPATPQSAPEPIYPYNLSLSLTDAELQKLGIDCITTVKGVGYKFEL